ncbi:hypothetical protein [Methylobacterium nodulans]|nr:hypothetical protein [Methylobacterium nodulans]
MHRRAPEARKALPKLDDNPFTRVAAQFGLKMPMDINARLAAMTYQGAGSDSIHATQLEVSAALINRGHSIDEATEILLTATKAAAGDYGARWNWTREERAIRKHPEVLEQEAEEAMDEADEGDDAHESIETAEERAEAAEAAREQRQGGPRCTASRQSARR